MLVELDKKYKIPTIIRNAGKILKLVVQTENTNVHFIDSCAFLSSALKDTCKSFDLPRELVKGEFDFKKFYSHSYDEIREELTTYLKMDVISLSLIMIKFMNAVFNICENLGLNGYIDFKKHFSAANLTYGLFKLYNSTLEK
jgi:hypothetical protein